MQLMCNKPTSLDGFLGTVFCFFFNMQDACLQGRVQYTVMSACNFEGKNTRVNRMVLELKVANVKKILDFFTSVFSDISERLGQQGTSKCKGYNSTQGHL